MQTKFSHLHLKKGFNVRLRSLGHRNAINETGKGSNCSICILYVLSVFRTIIISMSHTSHGSILCVHRNTQTKKKTVTFNDTHTQSLRYWNVSFINHQVVDLFSANRKWWHFMCYLLSLLPIIKWLVLKRKLTQTTTKLKGSLRFGETITAKVHLPLVTPLVAIMKHFWQSNAFDVKCAIRS